MLLAQVTNNLSVHDLGPCFDSVNKTYHFGNFYIGEVAVIGLESHLSIAVIFL